MNRPVFTKAATGEQAKQLDAFLRDGAWLPNAVTMGLGGVAEKVKGTPAEASLRRLMPGRFKIIGQR